MKWEWVVPVIVVTLWIINAIVKSRENDEPVRPKRPGGAPRENRNPTGDIDRFLQEIDKLRQKTAEERGTPPPPPVVRPVPVPRVRPVPTSHVPRVRLQPRPTNNRGSDIPVVEAIPLGPSSARAAALAAPTFTTSTQMLIPSMAGRLTPMNAVEQPRLIAALKLLRSRNGAATAIALHEIFGPPKCKRRG